MSAQASTVGDRRLQTLLDYWRDKRQGREMPARADIDPVDLRAILPFLILVDVLEDGRFRYRLFGTANATAAGRDATGLTVEEFLPRADYAAYIAGLYAEAARERVPVYAESDYLGRPDAVRRAKRLMLPLSADGRRVDIVLCGQVFDGPLAEPGQPAAVNFRERFRTRLP